MANVCLVCMPYGPIKQPSIALGLLKASLTQNGIQCSVAYASLRFAAAIGLEAYETITHLGTADALGEWTFSGVAFPDFAPAHAEYLNLALRKAADPDRFRALLWKIRDTAAQFTIDTADRLLEGHPRIVGCTSSFQQHCASLALLRCIKERDDSIITLIGGANCEGPMGHMTHSAFDWVDFVVSGEADDLFPRLTMLLLEKGKMVDPSELPYGVIGARSAGSPPPAPIPRAVVSDLDSVPIPDYDEYFEELRASPLVDLLHPGIPFETSRGCWWGQKHQCTFCGLNGAGIHYRVKSARRTLEEMHALRDRYKLTNFEATDNVLDLTAFKELLPALASEAPGYNLFYETRTSLSREQMEQMSRAGIRWIQPGIENLHDAVLALLNKGNTALSNIRFLRWACELGIRVSWNLLTGAPGEDDAWYQGMMEWLPLLVHLEPPRNLIEIRYDRFSRYHQRPMDFGLDLVPRPAYSYIYPLEARALSDLAYFFVDRSHQDGVCRERPGLEAVKSWVLQWNGLFFGHVSQPLPKLERHELGDRAVVLDSRPCAVGPVGLVDALSLRILRMCDNPQDEVALCQTLGGQQLPSAGTVKTSVQRLVSRRYLLRLDGKLLNLTAKAPTAPLLPFSDFPGGWIESDVRLAKDFLGG